MELQTLHGLPEHSGDAGFIEAAALAQGMQVIVLPEVAYEERPVKGPSPSDQFLH